MKLKNTIFILVLVVLLLQMMRLNQEATHPKNSSGNKEKIQIALSTFPLYEIAKNITQGKMEVFMILPAGVDVHSYEPNPKQILKLYKSDLVVYSGASLEPWIERLNFPNKTLNISKFVTLKSLEEDEHHHHDAHHEHEDAEFDPHYWLSIENMKKATKAITQEIITLDAQNRDFYLANQERYLAQLTELDTLYKERLSSCEIDEIFTNHNAFSYLAQSYNFHVLSLSHLSPDAQSNAKNMIKVIEEIKKRKAQTIFYESFASARGVSAIAKESGISLDVLQPLANITAKEQEQNLSYIDIMRENLTKISKAMRCR